MHAKRLVGVPEALSAPIIIDVRPRDVAPPHVATVSLVRTIRVALRTMRIALRTGAIDLVTALGSSVSSEPITTKTYIGETAEVFGVLQTGRMIGTIDCAREGKVIRLWRSDGESTGIPGRDDVAVPYLTRIGSYRRRFFAVSSHLLFFGLGCIAEYVY